MSEENFLLRYLQLAGERNDYDYHLAYAIQNDIRLFENKELSNHWQSRLAFYETFDITISPIFEAVKFYGKWVVEKDYQSALNAIQKFYEMEIKSIDKKWFYVFIESIEQQISLNFKLRNKENLKEISERVFKYLSDRINIFKPNIVLNLFRQFIKTLKFSSSEVINKVYDLFIEYVETYSLNYVFKEQLLNELINIKKYQKQTEKIDEIYRKILNLKLEEAEKRSLESKLIYSTLLERALEYCSKFVRDKKIEEELKRKLKEIDYSNELKTIELPEEIKSKFETAIEEKWKMLENTLSKYIEKIRKLHPINILYNMCSDESLFMMDVTDTKEFTRELMREYPIQHLFTTTVDLGGKEENS